MNKEWVNNKNLEARKEFEHAKQKIRSDVIALDNIPLSDKEAYVKEFDSLDCHDKEYNILGLELKLIKLLIDNDVFDGVVASWREKFSILGSYQRSYDEYLDSEPVEFDGDIIITDPCYIIKENSNDWDKCSCGYDMESLGIYNYITRDTLYGDWDCTTFDTDSGKKIGEFCSDAGLVSVFGLKEVLKYNSSFNLHNDKKWTTTLIENFKGVVQFVVECEERVFDHNIMGHKKGDTYYDFSVKVVGHGINKKTGEPINFVGKQTGF